MKRDIIKEIISVKERTEYSSRHEFTERLNRIEESLKESFDYNGDFDTELLKYIPIATVACFESFFRSAIAELIDFGKPYSDNVINLNASTNIKFEFEIVNAIQTKAVSIGEYVAHKLSYNNYNDINSILTTVTGKDFSTQIKTFIPPTKHKWINENSENFVKNNNQIIPDVIRVFELRHIFCHEFATNLKIDKNEILSCFSSSKVFLNQVNDYIYHLMYPNAPETQFEINEHTSIDFQKAEAELTELILKIKGAKKMDSALQIDIKLFDKSIAQWRKYRKLRANVDGSIVGNGSMYYCIYVGSLTRITNEKIESLKKEYQVDLKRYAKQTI